MRRRLILHVLVPTLLTVALFAVTIFLIAVPEMEQSILDRKREMIRELTTSAWNILASFEQDVERGKLTREEAQRQAIRQIRNLHYGPEMKDYFWINDLTPRMVVHPYRHDLEGQDLSQLKDPDGKRLFVEFVAVARAQHEGFVAYRWQWKDDSSRIVPKLSFVKLFDPWGWVIGTGVYLEDVRLEVRATTHRLMAYSGGILLVVAALLTVMLRHGLQTERARLAAEEALRASEERYRLLVESAGESIIMAIEGQRLYANANALQLLGYTAEEFAAKRLGEVVELAEEDRKAGGERLDGFLDGRRPAPGKRESRLVARSGATVPVLISFSPISVRGQEGVIIVATDITRRKLAEEALDRSHTALQVRVADMVSRAAQHEAAARELRSALLLAGQPGGERLSAVLDRLRATRTPRELAEANRSVRAVARGLVEGGWRPEAVSQFMALNTDAVVDTLIRLAIERQGPAPVPFVFLVLGSEGRREQTLCADQDNALLFADTPADRRPEVDEYFRLMGEWVCDGLDLAGYDFCEGQVMARNPKWRMPLSGWQECFTRWIRTQSGDDLLQSKVFFDYRCGYGEERLLDPLRETLRRELAAHPSFLPILTIDVLEARPPLALFGGIAAETAGDQRKGFDIKMAMLPIVDFARVYALRHDIAATNTLERLTGLLAAGALNPADHREMSQVYAELMRVRISNQLDALAAGRALDNFVELHRLTLLQRRTLRECFEQIRLYQGRLARDFTGSTEGVR